MLVLQWCWGLVQEVPSQRHSLILPRVRLRPKRGQMSLNSGTLQNIGRESSDRTGERRRLGKQETQQAVRTDCQDKGYCHGSRIQSASSIVRWGGASQGGSLSVTHKVPPLTSLGGAHVVLVSGGGLWVASTCHGVKRSFIVPGLHLCTCSPSQHTSPVRH